MIPTVSLTGYSLVFIPRSWALGVWRKPHKTIYSLGPFRFAVHRSLIAWRDDKPTLRTWRNHKMPIHTGRLADVLTQAANAKPQLDNAPSGCRQRQRPGERFACIWPKCSCLRDDR